MKRNGQVALYLVMVLFAITMLVILNVNVFLAVRDKNRNMNAVDHAALAAAKCQGALLNEIGRLNVEMLKTAVTASFDDNEILAKLGKLQADMRKLALFGPIGAIEKANDAARKWGAEGGSSIDALAGFRDHIQEIKTDLDLYPQNTDNPWESDLWRDYAQKLEAALGGNLFVLPGFMEMANPGATGLFANGAFYDVIASQSWCWFTVGGNMRFLEQDPSQIEVSDINPVEVPENSEVFALHVTFKSWTDSEWSSVGFTELWTNFVCRVTGLTPDQFSPNAADQVLSLSWAFYDEMWRPWATTFNSNNFPIAGDVRPEYDVAGCVASCRMYDSISQIQIKGDDVSAYDMQVTAEAKPLGTVEDHLNGGGTAPVTAYHNFIAPSRPDERIFTTAQLVLMGSVPRKNSVSMEPDWYEHIKHHSPQELQSSCGYCSLWRQWKFLRTEARAWLRANEGSCRSQGGEPGSVMKGGYEYAH